eukprot:scaffold83_cov390-Pavlova_lutheri.AAC.6
MVPPFHDKPIFYLRETGLVSVELTSSEPKTGTTVLAWLVAALFKRICKQVSNDVNVPCRAEVDGRPKFDYVLKIAGRTVHFFGKGKHDVYACGHKLTTRSTIERTANACVQNSIPAWSVECLQRLNLSMPHRIQLCKGKQSVNVMTFRHPVATTLSWVHYKYGYSLSRAGLNEQGYNMHTFAYADLHDHPLIYASRLARVLGFALHQKMLEEVLEDTAPDRMRSIQEDMKNGKYGSTMYHGLSGYGENSRKVGNATNKLYLQLIDPSVVDWLLAGLGSRAIVEHIWNCVKYLMPNSISACLENFLPRDTLLLSREADVTYHFISAIMEWLVRVFEGAVIRELLMRCSSVKNGEGWVNV